MSLGFSERKVLINKLAVNIPISRQCELLGIPRSAYYYASIKNHEEDDLLKRKIDEIYLKHPFYGSRRISNELRDKGSNAGRYKVRRLMREMGIVAIYPRKRITCKTEGHKVYPYLLGNLDIYRSDLVWCSDISYIPLKNGTAYLTVVMDWYSRYIISWELSMSQDSSFCSTALKTALSKGKPVIFNTDQGSQYTSNEFTGILKDNAIWISMSGKGRAFDNIMIERLWRTVKYEEVYLKEYKHYYDALSSIEEYISYYNEERRHSSLGNRTPKEVYLSGRKKAEEAA